MFAGRYLNAFPDMAMTVDDVIAEGEKFVVHWTAVGKYKGELMGIPATDKDVTVTGIAIDRFAGGKIVESWGEFDMASSRTCRRSRLGWKSKSN